MKSYNILLHDFNHQKVTKHDIMPYLVDTYSQCMNERHWWPLEDPSKPPVSETDIIHFVTNACKHKYWARCQYEWLMVGWPPGSDSEKAINQAIKVDAWEQIEVNLARVVEIFQYNIMSL